MKKILFVILGIFIISAGVVFALNNANQSADLVANKKILITYYSHSGNTKAIAEKLHAQVGGDMFEIKTVKKYPSDYTNMTQVAKKEQETNRLPEIVKFPGQIEQYDIIFVGTPVWWGKMSNPVKSFLSDKDLKNKTVIPFITHGGGGKYNIAEDISKLTGSKVMSPLVLHEDGGANATKAIAKWLKEIKYN